MPFCPRCRSKFRDGFKRCSDCQTDLVASLPAPESRTAPRLGCARLLWILLGTVGVLFAVSFVPFFDCYYCHRERQDIDDWLSTPTIRKYREEHPEAVAQAREDLRRIDGRCRSCFHGKISFWRTSLVSRP